VFCDGAEGTEVTEEGTPAVLCPMD
jgi:hypothetical protein